MTRRSPETCWRANPRKAGRRNLAFTEPLQWARHCALHIFDSLFPNIIGGEHGELYFKTRKLIIRQ